jgi:hypothetical protein
MRRPGCGKAEALPYNRRDRQGSIPAPAGKAEASPYKKSGRFLGPPARRTP